MNLVVAAIQAISARWPCIIDPAAHPDYVEGPREEILNMLPKGNGALSRQLPSENASAGQLHTADSKISFA
jgi:hypothetical protein